MISVIIPVGKEEPHVVKQVKEIRQTIGNVDYEIILVTNDKKVCAEPSNVKWCVYSYWNCGEARNMGAQMAEGNILVFSDAHTEYLHPYSDGWGETIELAFRSRKDIGVATLPRYTITGPIDNQVHHYDQIARGLKFNSSDNLYDVSYITPKPDGQIPFIWGDFIALSKNVFEVGGGFIVEGNAHMEDRCFCIAASLFGYKNICIDEGKKVGAYIRPQIVSFPYAEKGTMALQSLHYTGSRLESAKDWWVNHGHPPEEFEVVFNRCKPLRDYYLKHRKYTDDWYFTEFLPTFR